MKKILLPHQLYLPSLNLLQNHISEESFKYFSNSLSKKSYKRNGIIYIHIPFCDSRCVFCGFDSCTKNQKIEDYIKKIKEEIKFYSQTNYINSLNIIGCHIGGGTPTYLPLNFLKDLIYTIKKSFKILDNKINIEGSITTLSSDKIKGLKSENINKLSFGVQTFNPELRKILNLNGTLNDIKRIIKDLSCINIKTHIDLMHGFPDFKIKDQNKIIIDDIKIATELNIDGIEISQFYPFFNPLEKIIHEKNMNFLTTTEMVKNILEITKILEDSKFKQLTEYNFCKNENMELETPFYGNNGEIVDCIGIGASAIGLINNVKYINKKYDEYIHFEKIPILSLKSFSEIEIYEGIAILSSKLLNINKNIIKKINSKEFVNKINVLIQKKFLNNEKNYFKLTNKGKCFIDNICFFLMNTEEKKKIQKYFKILYLD